MNKESMLDNEDQVDTIPHINPINLTKKDRLLCESFNTLNESVFEPFSMGNNSWVYEFLHICNDDDEKENSKENIFIAIEYGKNKYTVLAPEDIVIKFLQEASNITQHNNIVTQLPPWLQTCCLEASFNDLLIAIENKTGEKIAIAIEKKYTQQFSENKSNINFLFQIKNSNTEEIFLLQMKTDKQALNNLVKKLPIQNKKYNPVIGLCFEMMSIECSLILCVFRFSKKKMKKIKTGDIFQLPSSKQAEDGSLYVRGVVNDTLNIRGRYYTDKVVIDMVSPKNDNASSNEDDDFFLEDEDEDEDEDELDEDEDEDKDEDEDEDDENENEFDEDEDGLNEKLGRASITQEKTLSVHMPEDQLYSETIETIDDVPFSLELRVAKLSIPFKNFKNLHVGLTIDLEEILPPMVDFLVQDRVIGRGELVDIEGSLGVVITQLGNIEDK